MLGISHHHAVKVLCEVQTNIVLVVLRQRADITPKHSVICTQLYFVFCFIMSYSDNLLLIVLARSCKESAVAVADVYHISRVANSQISLTQR